MLTEKRLGDLTIFDIATLSGDAHTVVTAILDAIDDMPKEMADHLRRCIYVKGDALKYDHGDEPAMTIGEFCTTK